ncbi:hypothetical protein [Geosporobacter ferrireducens]|nr:hypothetical protein [Geosporobacter ferrireducens]
MNIFLILGLIFMLGVIAWNIKQGFLIIEERLKKIEEYLRDSREDT